jgi:CTP:molybdopterin cytidylyltransferase MocA
VTALAHISHTLRRGGCASIHVVTAPPHDALIATQTKSETHLIRLSASRSMAESLAAGLACLLEDESVDAAVIALLDHPEVSESTVQALLGEARHGSVEAVSPRHGGRGGHPFVLARAAFPAFLDGRESPRTVLARLRRAFVEVDDPAILQDLDDKAAWAPFRNG